MINLRSIPIFETLIFSNKTTHFKPLTSFFAFEVVGRRDRSFNYSVPQAWQREGVLSKYDVDIKTDKQLLQKSRYGRFNTILHRILNSRSENCHSKGNYIRVSVRNKNHLKLLTLTVYWQDIFVCVWSDIWCKIHKIGIQIPFCWWTRLRMWTSWT